MKLTKINIQTYKNKYTKYTTKNNLKTAEDQIVQGNGLTTRTYHNLLLGLESTLLLGLAVT